MPKDTLVDQTSTETVPPVTPTETPLPEKTNSKSSLPLPLIVGIIIVLIAVIGGGIWFMRRNKSDSMVKKAEPVSISFIGQPVGVNYDFDKKFITEFEKKTGITVNYIAGPESATDRIALYLKNLQSNTNTDDVYIVDVIWPGLLANYLVDLNTLLPGRAQSYYQSIVQNNTVDGRLVAMPFFTDTAVLYYRTDLLQKYGYTTPPNTWDEMQAMATKIQAGERKTNPNFWGYVWQGAAYEGLTCDALELQASFGGGVIIDSNGKVSVNNPETIQAFTKAASWIGTISPKNTGAFQEEDSRSIWQAGNALFMRNWPYAYSLGQKSDSIIKDKFSVAVLPSGGSRHADALGGWQLAVSKNSKHQKEAAMFIDYMTSEAVQKQRAVEGSYLPTRSALANDADIQAANPYYKNLGLVFASNTVARPSTIAKDKYNDVSMAYYKAVNSILTKQASASVALPKLETDLKTIMAKGTVEATPGKGN